MTDTLVDTNVILDVINRDAAWFDWSSRQLAEASDAGALVINQIVYSELAAGFTRREDLEAALRRDGIRQEGLPWDAAFLAGVAFLAHRRKGGSRSTIVPDFLIGAHAAVRGYRLLTRDRRYYATYFPTLELVTPGPLQ